MYLREKKTLIFAMQSHICNNNLPPWGTNTKSKNFKFLSSTNLFDPIVKQSFTRNITLAQCGYPFGCTHASDSSIVISQRVCTEEVNRPVKNKPSASFDRVCVLCFTRVSKKTIKSKSPLLTSRPLLTSSMLTKDSKEELRKDKILGKQSVEVKALVTQLSNDSLGVVGYSCLLHTGRGPQLLQIGDFASFISLGKQSLCFVSEGGLSFLLKQSTQTLSKQNSYLYSKPFLASQLFIPKEYKFSLLETLLASMFHYGKYNVSKESKAVGVKTISKTNFVTRNELDVICQPLIDNKEITLLYLPALYYLLPLIKHREILFFSFAPFSKTRKLLVSGVSQCEYWKGPGVEKDIYINFFYPNIINRLYSLQNTNTNTEIKDFYFFKFFIYFFQFRLKKGWTYWPHRILCLPLAFHRRIVKLVLLKQKKKNIRYSKINLISTTILAMS